MDEKKTNDRMAQALETLGQDLMTKKLEKFAVEFVRAITASRNCYNIIREAMDIMEEKK